MKLFILAALLVFPLSISGLKSTATVSVERIASPEQDLNEMSEELLLHIKNEGSTTELRAKLYNFPIATLQNALKNDRQKLAFWINIYNAYIQIKLSENPSLYEDRDTFFKKEQVPIAGRLISFDKIEHGIIRKSQWKLGLGLISKWFPDEFERKLRVDQSDYRIHFALNCGAKDCPPVAIYEPYRLDEQLRKATERYLRKTSTYDPATGEVTVTSLFSWFRGDFGLESGIKKILKKYGIIPTTENISLSYTSYDWTLDLDNWREL